MPVDKLTKSNLFHYYFFNPRHQNLSACDKKIATFTAIILSIPAGLGLLFCRLFLYNKNYPLTVKKTSNLANQCIQQPGKENIRINSSFAAKKETDQKNKDKQNEMPSIIRSGQSLNVKPIPNVTSSSNTQVHNDPLIVSKENSNKQNETIDSSKNEAIDVIETNENLDVPSDADDEEISVCDNEEEAGVKTDHEDVSETSDNLEENAPIDDTDDYPVSSDADDENVSVSDNEEDDVKKDQDDVSNSSNSQNDTIAESAPIDVEANEYSDAFSDYILNLDNEGDGVKKGLDNDSSLAKLLDIKDQLELFERDHSLSLLSDQQIEWFWELLDKEKIKSLNRYQIARIDFKKCVPTEDQFNALFPIPLINQPDFIQNSHSLNSNLGLLYFQKIKDLACLGFFKPEHGYSITKNQMESFDFKDPILLKFAAEIILNLDLHINLSLFKFLKEDQINDLLNCLKDNFINNLSTTQFELLDFEKVSLKMLESYFYKGSESDPNFVSQFVQNRIESMSNSTFEILKNKGLPDWIINYRLSNVALTSNS